MNKNVDYKNDFAFRYIFGSDSKDSIYLLTVLVEGALGIKVKQLQLLNPELIPSQMNDKDMILDIKVLTNHNEDIDIEMQNSCFHETLRKRFQVYGAQLLARQLKEGEPYRKIHHVSQIIFIDDMNKKTKELVNTYESRNKEGEIEEDNLITRAFVQLPYINEVIKYKNIEAFSDFEWAVYVFKNGFDDVIIGLRSQVINMMKEKLDHFNEDDQLRDIAFKRMLVKMQREGEREEKYDEGYNIGKEEGLTEGHQIGKEEGLAEGHKIGKEEGKEESKQMIIHSLNAYIQSKFHEDIEDLLKGFTIEKLIKIQGNLFTANTIEEIKELLKR